jgi:phosphoribosyl-AMP cyclohydrolase
MNQDALEKTIETGKVHVFRRSKNRLMLKGETSGHTQSVERFSLIVRASHSLLRLNKKLLPVMPVICHVITGSTTIKPIISK